MRFKLFIVALAAIFIAGCHGASIGDHTPAIKAGITAATNGVDGAKSDVASAQAAATSLQGSVSGAHEDVRDAQKSLGANPPHVTDASRSLNNADPKLTAAEKKVGELQQLLSDSQTKLAQTSQSLATANQATEAERQAFVALTKKCDALQAFYDTWINAILGPRTWRWVHAIFFSVLGIGVLIALVTIGGWFFPAIAAFVEPILKAASELFGHAIAFVITAGIPHAVIAIKYLVTRGTSLVKTFVQWIENIHASRVAPKATGTA